MAELTKTCIIKATGIFLAFYESDLNYITRFQQFKRDGKLDYLDEGDFSFLAFLSEFRISRNISKLKQKEVLKKVKKWCKGDSCDDVDMLAKKIKEAKHSHGKLPLSFSSKVLFLNNPQKIFPLDRYGKNALGLGKTNYQAYYTAVKQFVKENQLFISESLNTIENMTVAVEANFRSLNGVEIIRRNRFADKLLWVCGNQ